MKLKYTLVFTIISFFIAAVGFSQTYSDKEIGFDVERATLSLKEHGIFDKDLSTELAIIRKSQLQQYIDKKKIKDAILQKIKDKEQTKLKSRQFAKTGEDTDIPQSEKSALLAFYNSLNGTGWGEYANWNFNTPVTNFNPATNTGWRGVTVTNGHVTSLEFLRYALMGTLPGEIGQLSYLETLYLPETHLSGSIPPELGQLSKLKYLDLSSNDLTGTIPVEITQLSSLEYLDLDQNKITGTISSQINRLTKLKFLDFASNKLTGPIPVEIGDLSNLTSLWLSGNQLSGTLPPQIGQLTNLTFLNFTINELEGTIPPQFGQLSNLEHLQLDQNKLTGSLPPELGQLNKLLQLKVTMNKLEGNIPVEYGQMSSLTSLELSANELSGNFPIEVAQLQKLFNISISNNKFSGIIPNLANNKPYLYGITIHNNNFRFIDFATEHATYLSRLSYHYSYAPQAKTDSEQSIIGLPNKSVTFTMCEDNRYIENVDTFQWYKGVSPNGVAIPGANTRKYTISDLSSANSGDYYCLSRNAQITNPNGFSGQQDLILERNTIHLTVNDCVNGKIITSPENASLNSTLTFSLETTSTNLTYKWTFYNPDDSVASVETTSTVTKLYNALGNYKVNLVVTDENGCTTTFNKIIPICTPVTGTIVTDANNLLVNANTYFHFETTSTNLTHKWIFYDLNNNVSETFDSYYALKSFDAAGTYKVDLILTNENGCPITITRTVTVTQPQACHSEETGTMVVVGENDTVYIDNYNQFYFDTNTNHDLHYKWTIYNPDNTIFYTYIGNDNNISGLDFQIAGNYKATLEITDMSGCTATFNKTFLVTCSRTGNIYTTDGSSTQVLPNTEVSFLLEPRDFSLEGMQQNWEFISPSGEIIKTGSANTFSVIPTELGDYQINVKITDPTIGCINNFTTILKSVDECTFTDKNRFAYISPNGEYAYSNMALYYNLNDTINFALFRPFYWDTGKVFNLEWSLYDPNSELISTSNEVDFPITLTTAGFYKVVVNVIDPDTGCSSKLTRSVFSTIQGSCTETNERSYHVQDLVTNLTKRLITRCVIGETDAQINANSVTDEFTALKPFITNSPKDKVYNFATTRNEYGRIDNVTFSFSPDRASDVHISFRDGLDLSGNDPEYIYSRVGAFIYIDLTQYVSSDQYLGSCSLNYSWRKNQAKSAIEPDACYYSSEIKNINFCPPACTSLEGTIKTSAQNVFTNRTTNFALETTATDLTYKWTFYTLGNEDSNVYTTNTVDKKYTEQGSYDIRLEVTDSNGCVTTFDKTVVVTINTECTPLSGAIKTPTSDVYVLTNTTFSLETAETDLTYKWTFYYNNESTVFTTKTVDYTYGTPGTYNVTLEVTDLNGCKSNFQKTVALKTGPALCDNITQYGRAYIKVDGNEDIFKSAVVNVNQVTNVTFPIVNYDGTPYNFTYKWSLYNDNDQLLNSGTALNFPITPTVGGYYKAVLELTEHNSGCVQEFTKSIVCLIPSSCTQTNAQSSVVKGLVVNVLKNLISRSIAGESDAQIDASNASAEFTALVPYITNGPKDKIYNYATARSLTNEITGVNFSFSPNSAYDIHLSVPHDFQYQQGMPLEYLLGLIESKINLNQYVSPNQYLVTCLTPSRPTGKSSLLQPSDCTSESEIRYINFCPNDCLPITGILKTNPESPMLNVSNNFSLETSATGLTYNWIFYNLDNSEKERQNTASATQIYTAAGNYKVHLIVTDANSCTTTFTKIINIPSNCIPIAGTITTSAQDIYINTNTTFSFENTSTDLTYLWTFQNISNSTTFTTPIANYSYQTEGNYNITLVVTDVNGCTNTFNKTITALYKAPCVPIAGEIKIPTETVNLNETTTFSFQTTATNFTYKWTFFNTNFVEIGTATTSTVNRSYNKVGDYLVRLVVTDENGCITTIGKSVKVVAPCNSIDGTIKVNTENPALFTTPVFTFETTDTNLTYTWNVKIPENGGYYNDPRGGNEYQFYLQYGEGDYTILLDVKDSNNCVTHFEKIITVKFDCSINPISGSILNMSPGNDFSNSLVLVNTPTPFVFYPYSNITLSDMNLLWELVNDNGNVITSATTEDFTFSATEFGNYKLNFKIIDTNGCVHNFSKDLQVVNECTYTDGERSGSINFDNEYSNGSAFIEINQTKDLTFYMFNQDPEKTYTYHWKTYDVNNVLIDSGNNEVYPLTLTTPGFHRVTLDVTNTATSCTSQFTKTIGCLINNSCTQTNSKSQLVKEAYINFLKSLTVRSLTGETDVQINASSATAEFIALAPYITNGPKDKIYNFKSTTDQEGNFSGFSFSFSPDRDSDIFYHTRWSLYYDPTDEYSMSRIEQTLYFNLDQYVSSDEPLISCYVDNGGKSIKPLPPHDCAHQTIVRYIDFCPAEECKPIVGILKSANTTVSVGKSKIKKSSSLKNN